MKIHRWYWAAVIEGTLLLTGSAMLQAQDTPPDGYVTRKEYEELKAELLAMKKELDTIKDKEAAPKLAQAEAPNIAAKTAASQESVTIADSHKQVAADVALPA